MKNKNWFEVDKDGLKELQAGKPKHYILRELIQNCWDEPITECKVDIAYTNKEVIIRVYDDSKIGFRDLKDSYTLFKHTYKRKDPEKRGKFNVGEKQSLSICEFGKVETTKGTVIFDENGRRELEGKTDKGTIVTVKVKATEKEFEEMKEIIKTYLVPKKIKFIVNNEVIPYKKPYKIFEAKLTTEIEQDNILKRTTRNTKVNILQSDNTWLYEMGIPVQKIDCKFSIDVQQKIPLGIDRETVQPSFLKDLYAEVLNNTYKDIEEEDSSSLWVREGISDERVLKESVESVINKRYGDKVCIANPFDRKSIDEAISKGYNVIYGSEMSKDEWDTIKRDDLIDSSSDLFGSNFTNVPEIEPDDKQKIFADYAKRIAKRLLGFDIGVSFVKGGYNMVTAQYGDKHLTFNVSKLNGSFFENPISEETTDLIIHELGHENGNHTEESYHKLITKLGAKLTMLALKEPEFFDGGNNGRQRK